MVVDFISKKAVKNIFKSSDQRPFKSLGQNFLINKGVLKKIIDAAELSAKDIVLEIGPGLGVLTQELARGVKKVIAVEKDKKMVEFLKENLKELKNIEIIEGDILKIFSFAEDFFAKGEQIKNCLSADFVGRRRLRRPKAESSAKVEKLKIKNYKVVANLPYYITSPTIRLFLEQTEARPLLMVLMVQKEVAQRIVSRPPRMNLLAISVQFYAKAEIVSYVSKNCFWPRPKVDSAILQIAPLINADRKSLNADLFFKVVKAGFSQPRKQILNNLTNGLKLNKEEAKNWLLENKINPIQRPGTLSLENWLALVKTLDVKK